MAGRILVVHRNELVLDVIQEMLQEIGYTVVPVVDGRRALAKAIADHFQLIIIDRNLTEDVDGVWLVERLRRYGIRTPIIGTATDGDWNVEDGSVAQVDCFLPAPFDSGELIASVKGLLERSPRREETIEDLLAPLQLDLPEPTASEPLAAPNFRPLRPPVEEPAAELAEAETSEPEYEAWIPPRISVPHGPPQVMVVHSHEETRKGLVEGLHAAGYGVTQAATGHEGYESALLTDFELIVTDLWLAGPEGQEMDGFEMIESLRKSGVDRPIAVVTGYITKKMVHELLEWRVGKILLNPSDSKPLLDFARTAVPVS